MSGPFLFLKFASAKAEMIQKTANAKALAVFLCLVVFAHLSTKRVSINAKTS